MTESGSKARRKTIAKNVAVVGFGNIGSGVVELLYQKGIPGLKLVKVVDPDLTRRRRVTVPPELLSTDWHEVVADSKVDIVVELIGGIEPAKSIQLAALHAGKDVVTANKKLLAKEGHEIFADAAELNRRIGFRASFVGCHALIHEFRQAGTAAKKFRRIYGILNGTSNYILSAMTRDGKNFEEALREAQAKGFAEANPSDDIDGLDTASKIRILLGLISNSYSRAPDFPVEGIRHITAQDVQYAGELGYSIKLVGVIDQINGVFSVSVRPTLVAQISLLGSLREAYNGTEIEDEYGVISGLVAPGAGTYPTADTVVKDLLDITEGRPMLMPDSAEPIALRPSEDDARRYYLRFSVVDKAGVLAQICNIFWKYNISIAAVIQKEAESQEYVPLIITTHVSKEGDVVSAVNEVDKLQFVKAKTQVIRILAADT